MLGRLKFVVRGSFTASLNRRVSCRVSKRRVSVLLRSERDREAAIGFLMAIIIRCFESLLSLVRATLSAFRAFGKAPEKMGK